MSADKISIFADDVLKQDRDTFMELQRRVFESGGLYTYSNSPNNAASPRAQLIRALPHRITSHGVETPVVASFPAIIVSASMLAAIQRLGNLLNQSFSFQRDLMLEHEEVRTLIEGGAEAAIELHYFDASALSSNAPRWMRVDFVIERDTLKPFIVDVNVLPGGLFFSSVIAAAYMAALDCRGLAGYSVSSWLPSLLTETHSLKGRPIIFTPPPNVHPFLNGEYAQLARLDGVNGSVSPLLNVRGEQGLIVRAFRLSRLSAEGLAQIRILQDSGFEFLPDFKLWSEDHLWAHFLRARASSLREHLGGEDATFLLDHLPNTYLVRGNGRSILADSGANDADIFEVMAANLAGFVIKQGDSSGGRGVTICAKGAGARARTQAMQSIEKTLVTQSGCVLQAFVPPAKVRALGIGSDGRIGWTANPIRCSGFFVDGRWVGGIATQAPTYKVQGGWNAVNVPVLWNTSTCDALHAPTPFVS